MYKIDIRVSLPSPVDTYLLLKTKGPFLVAPEYPMQLIMRSN